MRKPAKKAPKPPSTNTLIDLSYDLVCDMEPDVTAAGDFADAISFLAETLAEPEEARVVQRLAWTIKGHCDAISARRGNLFRFLHPNSTKFEKTGLPSDKVTS